MSHKKKPAREKARSDNSMGFETFFCESYRPYIWLTAICTLLYWQTISFDFTSLDDTILIKNNLPFISNLSNIGQAFKQNVFPSVQSDIYYRPLLTVSLMVDAQFAGEKLVAFHVTNILLHAMASCLMFLTLCTIVGDRMKSMFLALVFAVHPILSQAVAWIPGRNDTLLAVFALCALLSFIKYQRTQNWKWLVVHFVSFLASILTKEIAVLMPLGLLWYLFFVAGDRKIGMKHGALIATWAVAGGVWELLRSLVVHAPVGANVVGLLSLIRSNGSAGLIYLGKIFFPFNLSTYPIIEDSTVVVGVISVAIIAVMIVRATSAQRKFSYWGIFWFALFLIPSIVGGYFLEHRMYVPMLGILVMLAGVEISASTTAHRKIIAGVCGVVIMVLAMLSYNHSKNFRDDMTYWTSAAESSPHSAVAHNGLGIAYNERNKLYEALAQYKKAVELDTTFAEGFQNLGIAYSKLESYHQAEFSYRKAIELRPDFFNAHLNLAITLDRQGNSVQAHDEFKKALALNSGSAELYNNLGINLSKQGKLHEAEEAFIRALDIQPNYGSAHNNLSLLYYSQQAYAKAIESCDKAVAAGFPVSTQYREELNQYRK